MTIAVNYHQVLITVFHSFEFNSFIYFLDVCAEDIQCFTVKPILDLPAKFQNKPVSEQIVR